MGDERRRSDRKRLRRVIKPVALSFESDSAEGKGQVRSLSMMGMLVSCDSPPEVDEMVRIVFSDLEGCELELCGTVVSTRARYGQLGKHEAGFFMRVDADIDTFLAFYEQVLTGG